MARILLIDDERDLLELSQLCLEAAGHTVETLTEGRRAVEVAQRFRPDVIGLDWVIPDMSGEEVLRHLKESPETRSIPVVVMSALNGLELHAQRLGAACVLPKPFRSRALIEAMTTAVPAPQTHQPMP